MGLRTEFSAGKEQNEEQSSAFSKAIHHLKNVSLKQEVL